MILALRRFQIARGNDDSLNFHWIFILSVYVGFLPTLLHFPITFQPLWYSLLKLFARFFPTLSSLSEKIIGHRIHQQDLNWLEIKNSSIKCVHIVRRSSNYFNIFFKRSIIRSSPWREAENFSISNHLTNIIPEPTFLSLYQSSILIQHIYFHLLQ